MSGMFLVEGLCRSNLNFSPSERARLLFRAGRGRALPPRYMETKGETRVRIIRGKSTDEIRSLARATHGGNYRGDPGPFVWSNRTARNCIRHNLTNYEALWSLCNRGYTGTTAYEVLRARVDDLVDEAYPQFVEDDGGALQLSAGDS